MDYSLLLTFIAFFVFIGNMKRIDLIREFLNQTLHGRELLLSFGCSQIISNVPAAILLSGFTDQYAALLRGVNIGGLGTLIASLASLISYKFFAESQARFPEAGSKQSYILRFTIWNVGMAIILLLALLCLTGKRPRNRVKIFHLFYYIFSYIIGNRTFVLLTEGIMANTQYNADSITVLEGLEAVRKRPGMYIGGVGTKGLNHLIYEIVDNAVDEHLAGFCSTIWVTLEADGSCTVKDSGRGIPVEMHKKGVSAERVVLSTLHAGGKFDNEAYKTSGGLHGVGSSVVNALSAHMDVKIYKNGFIHHDAYERGIPTVELENGLLPVLGKTRQTGTEINFLPDDEIFEKTRFKAEWLKSRLHETAYLNPGLTIYYKMHGTRKREVTYHEPEGIIAYVKELNLRKDRHS